MIETKFVLKIDEPDFSSNSLLFDVQVFRHAYRCRNPVDVVKIDEIKPHPIFNFSIDYENHGVV
jgi:hypothetical protein